MSIPMHGGSLPREYKEAQYFSAMGTLSPQDTHPWVSLYHDSTSVMFLLALIHYRPSTKLREGNVFTGFCQSWVGWSMTGGYV